MYEIETLYYHVRKGIFQLETQNRELHLLNKWIETKRPAMIVL